MSLTNSYLTAALQLHANEDLMARYTDDAFFENIEPLTVSDAHAFISVAFDVRNAMFSMPSVMTHAKFSMTLQSMIRLSGSTGLTALDPFVSIDGHYRHALLRDVSTEYTSWCRQIMILAVRTSGTQLLSLPITGSNQTRFTQLVWNSKINGSMEICVRIYDVNDIATEDERDFWLRQVVSRSNALSEKSSILLADASVPLAIVPGCNTRSALRRLARDFEVQLECYL